MCSPYTLWCLLLEKVQPVKGHFLEKLLDDYIVQTEVASHTVALSQGNQQSHNQASGQRRDTQQTIQRIMSSSRQEAGDTTAVPALVQQDQSRDIEAKQLKQGGATQSSCA